jgi:hypothetical protein
MRRNKNGSVTLTRKELYREIWATPMSRLAREHGLSDRGLAKICERHRIPRPPRGYWAKRQFGQKPRQTPLPKEENQAKATITLWPGTAPDRSVDRRAEPTIEILVPETLAELHPLVARTEKSLRSARSDESGLVSPRAKKAMRVSVAPDSIDRAVRILDSLVRALEKLDYAVEALVDDKGRPRTAGTVKDEEVEFHLIEKTRREERHLSEREKRLKERDPWRYRDTQYQYLSTGMLSLQILTSAEHGMTRTWSDLKKCRLEKRLGLFVAALETTSLAIKRNRREEERERRWADEARIRRENRRLVEAEEERLKYLGKQVDEWQQSQGIREYIEAVKLVAVSRAGQMVDEIELEGWIEWAEAQADRLDPLAKTPPSILDNKPNWGWYWG